jgi:hypothetical protein
MLELWRERERERERLLKIEREIAMINSLYLAYFVDNLSIFGHKL